MVESKLPDSNNPAQRTEILLGKDKVMNAMAGFLKNAKNRMDLCAGVIAPSQNTADEAMSRMYFDLAKKGTRLRLIGEVTKERIEYVKGLTKTIEIRSISGVTSYFGVSDSEYVAVPGAEEFSVSGPILYSNEGPFVRHHQALFDVLWEKAIPADVRIQELDKGEKLGETRVTFSTQEILESAGKFVDGMKEEALVIVSREGGIRDNLELFEKIRLKANRVGADVKILGRFSPDETELVKRFVGGGFKFRTLAPGRITNLALGIYDRKGMGLVQYIYPDLRRPTGQTYLTGVISTNPQTVAGIAAIFDSLWEESELRQESELMRDILTHDIRNYNQISMSNAEVLKERLGGNSELRTFIDAIIGAIDGTSGLIEKTKILTSIIEDKAAALRPVNLLESMERSMSLVKKANPGKVVEASTSDLPRAKVTADSLLDQLFVNIFSNAVRYTEGNRVPLALSIVSADEETGVGNARRQSYWKVEVSDHGRGMPDDMKASAALRYLGTPKGKGLGLSIARALAVGRYSGRIEIKDRVEGDYSKGTKVEVWLPKAQG
jgi:signal transduction histidine kinase